MTDLTIDKLQLAAASFSRAESQHQEPSLFGIDNGKSIGTYLEQKFQQYLALQSYDFTSGNAASGIDLPDLNIDIKVTSIRQPQSSCPFRSARQKVYGLGYGLLLFVYEKNDDLQLKTANLKIKSTVLIEAHKTADFQLTRSLREILRNDGNVDDIMACLLDRLLPVDEISARALAEEIYKNPPQQGFLTISNALQWRLQYGRVLEKAGKESGLTQIYSDP